MNIKSDVNSGELTFNVYDKRNDFPFTVRRYPHTISNIPRQIPAAVFLGQVHRYYTICSSAQFFVANSCQLCFLTCARS